jgi:hypothetical protein
LWLLVDVNSCAARIMLAPTILLIEPTDFTIISTFVPCDRGVIIIIVSIIVIGTTSLWV